MTGREWKPGDGDLAFISWRSQSGRSGGSAVALRCSRAYDESHWQTQTFGEIPDYKVTDVRPLVVIDPEDREQIVRLLRGYGGWVNAPDGAGIEDHPRYVANMQAALREFANPTPPKPEEPTGLGAVVEDESQVEYIHLGSGLWVYGTTDGPSQGFFYDDIAAVRVLSEGVTS